MGLRGIVAVLEPFQMRRDERWKVKALFVWLTRINYKIAVFIGNSNIFEYFLIGIFRYSIFPQSPDNEKRKYLRHLTRLLDPTK